LTEVVLEGGKKRYWKQVLPLNKRIKYRDGRYLKTDRGFLTRLADSPARQQAHLDIATDHQQKAERLEAS
jgi:hypothetical protein